ncbi:cation transporter [Rheinheimera sp. D18]|uniref:cation transporter n=1 Tax=Rheinheimera sp. D18 TaxID=2545632 RepID=UPI001A9DEC0F|nr:cation transporter [Rheinheimera sp. D18]
MTKETILLFLQGTPDKKLMKQVRALLLSKGEVAELHHFHIWSLDGEHSVMTVHLVLKTEITLVAIKNLKQQLQQQLAEFNFAHTTIELEFADEACRDKASAT